ncbi:PHB depolymerase family esterase [Ramlibacter sp. AN1015]|uniref:extracellular catalytic domain type 1 short-chain-length polyhydroxyalkanoate depolymerase n=1 Tax=Ramlibacter sp. AN1015 TaxID=3133428 RepID=UPI0030C2143B
MAATRAIQQALQAAKLDPDGASGHHDGEVIDVEAREVPTRHAADPSIPVLPGRSPAPFEPARAEPVSARGRTVDAEPASARSRPAEGGPGSFVSGRVGGDALAGRDYKLFVPPGAGSRPMPLVLMLHGCTQDPDDFAAGTRMNELARDQGFFVLYAAQSQRANPQRCWNWFKHSHQVRGRGEPELLARMVREVMKRHAVDADRVYVAGLSAGAAMAAIVAAAYPELFAAVGVHSGLAPGAAKDIPSAFEAMKKGASGPVRPLPVPTIVFHGEADATVHPANGRQVITAADSEGSTSAASEELRAQGRRTAVRRVHRDRVGAVVLEHWSIHGAPHAWSGGSPSGSYTDPQGPDASAQMLRFFLEHPRKSR